MRSIIRRTALVAVLLQATICLAQPSFPERPIRIIMPFAPGGGGDLSVRALQENLSKRLGVPIVIDNRPGASGFIGAQAVANSAPDGYTLLMGFDGSLAIAPHILKPPFKPLEDLAPVTKLADAPLVLLAHPSVKAQNLKELIELSHRDPKGLSYGSAGTGTTHHLVGELLAQRTGIKWQHVPYKGGAAAVTDAVAGQIPLVVTVLPTAVQFIKDGRLKPIAVTSRERLPQLPEVGTVQEQGVPDFDVVSWYSIFAPARTPRPVIEKLRAAFSEVLAAASTREVYGKAGFVPVGNSPDEFSAQFRADYQRWAVVVKAANIQPD
jgi:tripartite-type tricarboxylate transporter receptor subunit TctC